MSLTDTWLKSQHRKAHPKAFVKADRDGLSARISPKGKITYTMRYYYNNVRKRLDIGTYPLMSLKEARDENTRLRKELEQGHDPKIVKMLELKGNIEAGTFEELFNQWYDKVCSKKVGGPDIKRSFELHVFGKLGQIPAKQLTLHHFLGVVEPLAAKTPMIASRVHSNASQCLQWAVKRQLLPANPLAGISAKRDLQITKGVGDRVLSDDEIRMLWMAIENSRIAEKNALFLKLCLIYACRCGELRLAEKSHFDFKMKIWTVPPENHKTGDKTRKPIVRPIIPATEAIIRRLCELAGDSEYLLPNSDKEKVIMKPSFHLTLPYRLNVWIKRHLKIEIEHWSVHDLRRTARTNFSTITQPHIAEIMLAHKLPGIWQVYDKYDYLKEQAEAYSAWVRRIETIVGIREPEPANDNVIELSTFRRA